MFLVFLMCICVGKGRQNLMKFGMVVALVLEMTIIPFIFRNSEIAYFTGAQSSKLEKSQNFQM
jgi:hypothetical protein